jgi:hypothetical protein
LLWRAARLCHRSCHGSCSYPSQPTPPNTRKFTRQVLPRPWQETFSLTARGRRSAPSPSKSRDQLFTDPGSVRAEPARRIMPSVSNAGDVPQPDGTPPTQRSVSLFGPIRNLSGLQPWRNTFIHHGRGRCIFLLLDCSLSPLPSWAFASARADCRRTSTGRPTCCSLTGPTGRAGAFALMTRSLVVPVREIHTRPASLTESESRKI